MRFTISRPFIFGTYRMLCFDVILVGRMAPAPPAYILPPQMPSRLNEIPYRAIFSMVNASSEMYRATPTFAAATSTSVFSAAFANQRIGALEQIRMVLDELAQADVHPLLVALRDEDQVDRHRAGDGLDRHQRVPVRQLRTF